MEASPAEWEVSVTEDQTRVGTVLVADDEQINLDLLLQCLSAEGYRILVAEDGRSAVDRARRALPDLILLDVQMPVMDGFEACQELKQDETVRDIPVIFMTARDDLDSKIRAFDLGASDYITKPFRHQEVIVRAATQLSLMRMRRDLESANADLENRVAERTAELTDALTEVKALKKRLQAENAYLQEEIREHHGHKEIIGANGALRQVLEDARRVAPTTTAVLISGETGTGKELLARTVHEYSERADRPLVKLNCAAISGGLVESELFGHVKGAFTGAIDKRTGRFGIADGGTLFLDEVSELPIETQAKLLRVLQEQEFEAVGSSQTQKVDVRIIAATNRDLPAEIRLGRFRSDLYFRLNVFPLEIPPLRDRGDDIAELAQYFLERFAHKHHKVITRISKVSMQRLLAYSWPGNVRDLQNVIERAVILAQGGELDITWEFEGVILEPSGAESMEGQGTQPDKLEDVERQHFIRILKRTRGVIDGPKGAAALLDLKPSTARFRIRKLGIQKSDYQG